MEPQGEEKKGRKMKRKRRGKGKKGNDSRKGKGRKLKEGGR